MLDCRNLLERLLTARPDLGPDEARRLAPPLNGLSDDALREQIARVRQSIAAKARHRRR